MAGKQLVAGNLPEAKCRMNWTEFDEPASARLALSLPLQHRLVPTFGTLTSLALAHFLLSIDST